MENDPSRPARQSWLGRAQTEAEAENRKLIKFSNYSLCVTLPKWVIKELKWGKGDTVKLFVDEKKGEILIKKDGNSSETKKKAEKLSSAKKPNKAVKSRW